MKSSIRPRRRFLRERRHVVAGLYGCHVCGLACSYPYRTAGGWVCSTDCQSIANKLATAERTNPA